MSAELLELGTKPVSEASPAGAPGRDEPEFEALQNELRKLELPDQPTPDWNSAIRSATALLGGKSKDLLASAYLCVALTGRDGWPGLETGLTVTRDMLANFWETLYPEVKRMRGRSAAIEWLAERGAQRVRRLGSPDRALHERCLALVEAIGELVAPHFDSGGSAISELRSALLEADVPSTGAAASTAAAASPAASGSFAVGGPNAVDNEDSYAAAQAEVRRLLILMGEYLRTTAPTNPLGYRLPRVATWMGVKQLPPNEGGKTMIPPPQPADLTQKVEAMLANQQWAGVLQECEGRIGTAVLWLDLHYWSATALTGMSPDHAACADAIAHETKDLLKRLPGIAELRFANDVPLAGAMTKAWIAQKVMAGGGGGPSVPATGATSDALRPEGDGFDGLAEAAAAARALLGERKLGEALGRLEEGAARATKARERAAWKVETARLCAEAGHAEAALAQLESLDHELARSTVESWDPALAAEVVRQTLLCRQKVFSGNRATPDEAARTRELLGRLARLDVRSAVEFEMRK